MSATNRGAKRAANDFYETPDWLTSAIVPYLGTPRTILEPAYGAGAIAQVCQSYWTDAELDGLDIVNHSQNPNVAIGDFLTTDFGDLQYDLVITNPPYGLAQEFVRKSLTLAPLVAMLLRINFLGSRKRALWLRQFTPAVFVSPRRPSFSLNKNGQPGTDATEYAWFVWGMEPRVTILDT